MDGSLDENRNLVDDGWADLFAGQLDIATAAWAEPGACDGTTFMGGVEMPAPLTGSLMLAELVVHGWDMAAATGQEFICDDDVAEAAREVTAQLAEQGRSMGRFADPVPLGEYASALDRALAVSGRDPAWTVARVSSR